MRASQIVSMLFPALLVGFFFGALCYKWPSLIVDVVSAAFALVPIWIVGYAVIVQSLKAALLSALFLFVALGVGFILIGFAIGAAIGFALLKIATREKQTQPGG